MNINNFVITGIKSVEIWSPVPTYEKLDIFYCVKSILCCFIGSLEAKNGLKNYLKTRKRNNKKYKDFWSDTSNIKFNDDKTQYLYMNFNTIKDIKIE